MRILAILCLLFLPGLRAIDATWNYAVEIAATVQSSPARITLQWKQDTNGAPASYAVYRKTPSAQSWGSPLATLAGSTLNFTDTSVTTGTAYEYQVIKDVMAARNYRGFGYIQAGIDLPLPHDRGTVILVVDSTHAASLASELQRLERDLVGDGWAVVRRDVGRGDSPASVKQFIRTTWAADPARVNTVFLFGRVPVPYSGLLMPDGHPDHLGAWPADVYYGDMDGAWTDATITSPPSENTDPADAARMRNVPGDGKFDQSVVPGSVRLRVGRVDLANMPGYRGYRSDPSFPSEVELLRRYLHKNHNFRHGRLPVQRRAVIADYTGDKEGIAAAASAFRSFAPIVGADRVSSLNIAHNDQPGVLLPALTTGDYLFVYGAGAGSYSTISGIGARPPYHAATSTDLVETDPRAPFAMLFGSWCGDWDYEDNIVRAMLATPTYGLAAVYTGFPHWFLHPMGIGEAIGYCAQLTQNNGGLYQHQINLFERGVHIALMGDPTLRLHPVVPATNPGGSNAGGQAAINWSASVDASAGYHVYRAASASGPFTRLTSAPIGQTNFTDIAAPAGATYMIRAVKLETTASGTYYNGSQGTFVVVGASTNPDPVPPPPPPPPPATADSRLGNLSVRSVAGSGSETLIVGFVVGGEADSQTLPLLIRATGPALRDFGVDGVLPNPHLTLYEGTRVAGTNDDWGANATQVSAVSAAVGAFRLANTASADAALVSTNGRGMFSAHVRGTDGAIGIALAEIYDATSGTTPANGPRLVNLSARTRVGTGADVLIAGFVVVGNTPRQVLIRGIGPGLVAHGVEGALARPQLRLYTSAGGLLATNTGWAGDAALAATFARVGAFSLQPNSADTALVATLPPGGYSAQVSGENATTGIALVEVYEVP